MKRKKIEPGSGQESVWDYPRPPALEDTGRNIRIIFNGVTIARTNRAKRVLETSHPPVYYIPPQDIASNVLEAVPGTSWCEWKGKARYFNVRVGNSVAERAAWSYPSPSERFALLRDSIAFYPSCMDACYVDSEQVRAQDGDFYGGWITSDIVGPFKGGPDTLGW